MRTLSLILMIIALVGLFLSTLDGKAADDALPILYASDTGIERVNGVLQRDRKPVKGVVIQTDSDGTTWSTYSGGLKDGRELSRYADGTLRVDRFWVEGKREGLVRSWWPDGSLKESSHYQHDVLKGESRKWFSNGHQASLFHYEAGQEEGAQQMWYEDGTIRANYAVIDGRRFGTNGTKGCTSEVETDD